MTQSTVNKLRECHLLKHCRIKFYYILYKQFSGHKCIVGIYGDITYWILSFPFLRKHVSLKSHLPVNEYKCRGAQRIRSHVMLPFKSHFSFWHSSLTNMSNVLRCSFDCLSFFQQCKLIILHKWTSGVNQSNKMIKSSQAKWHKHSLLHNAEKSFCLSTAVYISCAISLQKMILLQYKNHVKSSVITKRLCF